MIFICGETVVCSCSGMVRYGVIDEDRSEYCVQLIRFADGTKEMVHETYLCRRFVARDKVYVVLPCGTLIAAVVGSFNNPADECQNDYVVLNCGMLCNSSDLVRR